MDLLIYINIFPLHLKLKYLSQKYIHIAFFKGWQCLKLKQKPKLCIYLKDYKGLCNSWKVIFASNIMLHCQ